jgi:hypothetical protein
MKILNTVQELWSHCLYCPICKDICRDPLVSVGPDDQFQIVFAEKEDHILSVQCLFKKKDKKIHVTYLIDCLKNTFEIEGNDSALQNTYCYFYIQSDCRRCDATHTNGTDLELNLETKQISNIGIEREGIYLLSTKDKYHVTFQYDNNTMLVSKCFEDDDGMLIDDNKVARLPLVNLDFSKPRKAANRIKTLLVFS